MTDSEDILNEILKGPDSQFFYAHRNPQSSVPFESPDGKTYDIDLVEVAAIAHNADDSFEVDASAAWEWTDARGNVFRFCDNEDDTLTLVACTNASEEVIVPDSVDGKTVSAIAFFAFADCSGLTSLICPADATKIHSNAFKNCATLEKLVLPKNSRSVNRAWLKTLKQLRYLVLPERLENISSKVFVSVDLDYLYIGAHTKDIDAGAFNFSTVGCVEISPKNTELSTDGECIFKAGGEDKAANAILIAYYGNHEHYSIPAGCEEVFGNAFAYNKTLATIGMPDSLKIIGAYAFSNSLLEEFIAPKNLCEIQEKAFYFCSRMSRVILNDGLAVIGKEAFFKAPISELYIPASVTRIQQHAFYNTEAAMAEISSKPFGIQISPESRTFFIDEQGGLYEHTPAGLIFMEMLSLKTRTYTLDPDTAEIVCGAFLRHPYIEAVTLPEGLKVIGDSAFRGCKSLGTVNFPETLESIGNEAFVETVIEEAYIPQGLQYLGEMALRSSGKGFTHWLPGLKDLQIHPGNDRFFIEDGVLYQREDAVVCALQYIGPNENVRILDTCTKIAPYTFAGISSVMKLFLPANIERIGYSGLMFEDAVEEVTIKLKEPFNGHDTVTAYFSREIMGNQCMRKAFAPARLNIPDIFMYADRAIVHTHNFYTRARLSIERLIDPVYATPESIDLFQSVFEKELPRACREFAHNDFAKGFDYLIQLGYITKDNITGIIDKISETNDVAMIGYLLELKHRHFGSSVSLDLEL